MPALFVIDHQMKIRYVHYGDSMQDIPPTGEVLTVIDQLQQEATITAHPDLTKA